MQVLTFINEKGGVGKTTMAGHVAAGLAIRGKRVVIVDTDPQEANITNNFSLPRENGLYQLLVHNADWGKVIREPNPQVWAGEYKVEGSLLFLPSNIETRGIPLMIEEIDLLHHRLQELEDDVDVVVIDTSPTPSLLNAMIYIASDYMVHPTQTELPSIQGLASSMVHMKKAKTARVSVGLEETKLLGVIPTMHRSNTIAHQHGLNLIKERFGSLTWEPMQQSIVWGEATFARQMLYAYSPEHKSTDEAWYAVDKVMKGIA